MLSSLVTPLIHVAYILISTAPNFVSCALSTAHVSALYIIADLTTVLYFPLTLKLILRSHRTPDTLFQFSHPDYILFFIAATKSTFSANVAPRYLNVLGP